MQRDNKFLLLLFSYFLHALLHFASFKQIVLNTIKKQGRKKLQKQEKELCTYRKKLNLKSYQV